MKIPIEEKLIAVYHRVFIIYFFYFLSPRATIINYIHSSLFTWEILFCKIFISIYIYIYINEYRGCNKRRQLEDLKPLAAKVERNNTPRFLFFSNISKNTRNLSSKIVHSLEELICPYRMIPRRSSIRDIT